jgi:predicted ATP-grasp superfamily ATP-dependent carboligase
VRALIVEHGLTRQALAGARALAAAGWEVGLCASRERPMAGASRSVSRTYVAPEPQGGLDAFVAAVNAAIAAGGYEIVFGADDAQVLALSERRGDVDAVVPHAPHAAVVRSLDKLELGRAAERAGLAAPRTLAAEDGWPEGAPVPAVVKARLHASFAPGGGAERIKTQVVGDEHEGERRIEEIAALGAVPVVQEVVEGRLEAFVALVDGDGRLLACAQQRAGEIWPPHVGVSARAVTVPVDSGLADRVGAMLVDLGWSGLAELQFLVPPDGEPRVIDLNGRFYGSLQLAVSAGVNFPDLWARMATGRPVDGRVQAPGGVRYQWLEGDLKRALVQRRGGLVRDVAGTLRYAVGARHSLWSPRDPGPALHVAATLAGRAARRALGRR